MKSLHLTVAFFLSASLCSAQYYKHPANIGEDAGSSYAQERDEHLPRLQKVIEPKWTIKLDEKPVGISTFEHVAVLANLKGEKLEFKPIPLPDYYKFDVTLSDDRTSESFTLSPASIEVSGNPQIEMLGENIFLWEKEARILKHYESQWQLIEENLPSITVTEETVLEPRFDQFELQVEFINEIPLQLDRLDSLVVMQDSLFALGGVGTDDFVAITELSNVNKDSSWIIPGPLPENRTSSALLPVGDRLYVVGGSTMSNDQVVDHQTMLYSDVALPQGLSSFSQYFNPMPDASRMGKASVIHDMIALVGDTQTSEGFKRIHTIQRTDSQRMSLWQKLTINADDIIDLAPNPRTNQLVTVEVGDSEEDVFLRAYSLPQSFQLQQKTRNFVSERLKKKFEYVSLRAALKRAQDDGNSIIVLTNSSDDDVQKSAEKIFKGRHGKVMLQDIVVSKVFERDVEKFTELTKDMESIPSFIILNSDQTIVSQAEQILSDEELFEFLKPLWEANPL